MIDHFGIKVKDFTKSKDFYQKVLQPLGYQQQRIFLKPLAL